MKTVIITGTSTGIGFELVKIFSKKNYNVISLSRSSNVVNIGSKNIDHILDVGQHIFQIFNIYYYISHP